MDRTPDMKNGQGAYDALGRAPEALDPLQPRPRRPLGKEQTQ